MGAEARVRCGAQPPRTEARAGIAWAEAAADRRRRRRDLPQASASTARHCCARRISEKNRARRNRTAEHAHPLQCRLACDWWIGARRWRPSTWRTMRAFRIHVWVDETRPRNQGASLTAFELGAHGVNHAIIVDNAGGHLMQRAQGGPLHRRHRPRHRQRRRGQQDRHVSEGAGGHKTTTCRSMWRCPASTIDWAAQEGDAHSHRTPRAKPKSPDDAGAPRTARSPRWTSRRQDARP